MIAIRQRSDRCYSFPMPRPDESGRR